MASYNIGVLVRPIPDGAVPHRAKERPRLRLSLVLMPDATDQGKVSPFIADLSNWPSSVRSLTGELSVKTRYLKKTGGLADSETIPAEKVYRAGFEHNEKWQKAAQIVWDSIFADVEKYGGFNAVVEVLHGTQANWDYLGVVDKRTRKQVPRLTIAKLKPLEEAIRGIHANADLAFLFAHKERYRAPWQAATRGPLDPEFVEQEVSPLFAVHRPAVSANQLPPVAVSDRADGLQRVLLALTEIAGEEHPLDERGTVDAVVLDQAKSLTEAFARAERPRLNNQFMQDAQAIDSYLADGAAGRLASAAEQYRALRADTIGTPDGLQRILNAALQDGSASDWWQQMMIEAGDGNAPPPGDESGRERALWHAPTDDDVFEAMSELIVPQLMRDAAEIGEELAAAAAPRSLQLARALLSAQHEFAAFRLSLREGLVPDVLQQHLKRGPRDEIKLTTREKIQRKLAGIYAYPSLARFLGLIVDLEIDADAIKPDADFPLFGFVSAELAKTAAGSHTQTTTNWTAYKRFRIDATVDGKGHSIDYFRPLPSDELVDELRPVKKRPHTYRSLDGLLNLGQRLGDTTARYRLTSLDTAAAARSMEVVGHHVATAQAAGERASEINTFFAPKRSIGIALLDNARADEITETLARARDLFEQHRAPMPERHVLLFSEDLEVGYRLSIGRKTAPKEKKKWIFRSLHERSLSIAEIPKAYAPGDLAFRDAGYIRTGGRVVVKELNPIIGSTQNEALLTQALAVWRNWSLAVPAASPDHPDVVTSCEEGELPLTIDIGMPDKAGGSIPVELRLPALRYGADYSAVAEIVFQNGSSIGRVDAHWMVQTASYAQAALPAPRADWEHAAGFRFLRDSPIGAPTIHLAEPLHRPNTPESNLGEQVRRMVVRTGKLGPKDGAASRRFAIPPRTEPEVADLHGSFDRFPEMPDGALHRFRIDKRGFLPTLAPDGKITFQETDDPDSRKHGLGTIVVVNKADAVKPDKKGDAVKPDKPFFPDPLAERIMAMIDVPETGPGKDGETGTVSFYEIGKDTPKSWPDAYPVLIELKPVASIDGAKDFRIHVEPRSHDGVAVNALIVELAAAREVQLTLWCLPKDPCKLRGLHAGVADIARAAKHLASAAENTVRALLKDTTEALAGRSGRFVKAIEAIANGLVEAGPGASCPVEDIPVPSISHVEMLTLLHAVQRPLRGPTVPKEPLLDPILGDLKFVRIVDQPAPPPPAVQESHWEALLKKAGNDLTKVIAELRGTVVYVGGHIDFDRRSTEWLECRGYWTEYDDTKGPLDFTKDSATEYTIEHLAHRTLFLVGPLPRVYPGGDRLDLLRDADQALRNLNYDFKDTRARRMSIDLIATSRFSEEFNQPPANERESRPSGEVSPFQTKSRIATDYWFRSTDHPKPPEILDDETTVSRLSVTDYGLDADTGLRYAARTTRSYLHVRLARPWFSSGEGEKLGLVLWPPTIMTEVPSLHTEGTVLCDPVGNPIPTPGKEAEGDEWKLDQQLEPYISRWGADATRGTFRGMVAFPPMLITPDVIVKSDAKPAKPLRMPLPLPPPASKMLADFKDGIYQDSKHQYRYVAVMAFKVKPHVETQTWYCDIGLHPHHDDQTRVRLSLVRYQEYSLPGLELSTPVAKEVKLLPKRTLKVLLVNDRTVRVQVFGHSYDMKEVRAKEESIARLANVAYMAIELKQLFPKQPIIDEEQPIAGPTVKFSATVTRQVYQPADRKLPVGEDLKNITELLLSPRFDGATAFWESGDIKLDKSWTHEQFVLLVREIELVASSASNPEDVHNELGLKGLAQRQTYVETLVIRRERPKH